MEIYSCTSVPQKIHTMKIALSISRLSKSWDKVQHLSSQHGSFFSFKMHLLLRSFVPPWRSLQGCSPFLSLGWPYNATDFWDGSVTISWLHLNSNWDFSTLSQGRGGAFSDELWLQYMLCKNGRTVAENTWKPYKGLNISLQCSKPKQKSIISVWLKATLTKIPNQTKSKQNHLKSTRK